MIIRLATQKDFDAIWLFFRDIARAGDTYAYEQTIDKESALELWITQAVRTFVVEDSGDILGSYYIKTNQLVPGQDVCNCGYMVAKQARGRGLATLMCNHSQDQARILGYSAMQFNCVAVTNKVAVALWTKLGFTEVDRLTKAFNHPQQGLVDALVMSKQL